MFQAFEHRNYDDGIAQRIRSLQPGEKLPRIPSLKEQVAACGDDLDRIWLEALANDIVVSELEIREVAMP
jgi:hypothetical protein